MNLILEVEDAELLQRLLGQVLGNLRMEISNTDNLDWRQSLHADETRLKAILEQLPKN